MHYTQISQAYALRNLADYKQHITHTKCVRSSKLSALTDYVTKLSKTTVVCNTY